MAGRVENQGGSYSVVFQATWRKHTTIIVSLINNLSRSLSRQHGQWVSNATYDQEPEVVEQGLTDDDADDSMHLKYQQRQSNVFNDVAYDSPD